MLHPKSYPYEISNDATYECLEPPGFSMKIFFMYLCIIVVRLSAVARASG